MKTLFISHAHADQGLADAFARLLEGGINLSQKQIFCTSLEEQGIPAGQDFKGFIQSKLDDSEIVIALITPNYYASAFCMCELGAAWITAKDFLPFIVPPLGFDDLKGILSGMQVLRVGDSVCLDQARDRVLPLAKEAAGTARWTKRKDEFLEELQSVLKSLPKPKAIKPEELEKMRLERNDYKHEYDKSDKENKTLRKQIDELKKAKDKTQVAAIEQKYSSDWSIFKKLTQAAAERLAPLSNVVIEAFFQRIRRSEFRPSGDTWGDDPMEAVEEGLLEFDEDEGIFSVKEDSPKIRKTLTALRELRTFVEEGASEEFQKQYERKYEETLDIGIRPFWDRHLKQ